MIVMFRNLWRYRELTWTLVWREVIARYKQSLLGPSWALLQPLLLMLTFSFVNSFVGFPSDGVPYPVFAYAGLLPWIMFSNTVAMATPSIALNAGIIKKIYFPREVFPVSAALVCLFDFAMAFTVLLVLMFIYEVPPSPWIALLPVLIVVQMAFSLGVSFLTCALGTFKRDVIFAAFFVLQIWMYASPVIYPLSAVPEKWRTAYLANPMVALVESFRSVLIGRSAPDGMLLARKVDLLDDARIEGDARRGHGDGVREHYPGEQPGVREHGIGHAVAREPDERVDEAEREHEQQRLEQGPRRPEQALLVAGDHLAPYERPRQLAIAPEISKHHDHLYPMPRTEGVRHQSPSSGLGASQLARAA